MIQSLLTDIKTHLKKLANIAKICEHNRADKKWRDALQLCVTMAKYNQ